MKYLSRLILFAALAPVSTSQSVLHTFHGDSPNDLFGTVSSAGDMNADGFDDLVVGAAMANNHGTDSGSARVFSGLDGSILYTFDGDSAGDSFGISVSGAGDVNGDGYDDLLVGACYADNHGDRSGSALVFSGLDGSILYTFDGDSQNDLFGIVSGAGDLNGDGYDDLLVGAALDDNQGKDSGSVRAFSGRDGSVLYTLDGASPDDRFGFSVSGAGDVNGDGYDDLIVGAWGDDTHGPAAGSARVFSGIDVRDANPRTPAVPSESDRSAVNSEHVSDPTEVGTLTLHAADLPPNRVSYFFPSQARGFAPHPRCIQASRCLGGSLARFRAQIQKSGPTGEITIQVDLTSIPTTTPQTVMAGEAWNFQCWFRDDQDVRSIHPV